VPAKVPADACCCLQDSFYESTKASKFTHAGFSPAIVNLALAYHAAERGDDSQVSAMHQCETAAAACRKLAGNLRTMWQGIQK
jgi:hypothetical protein